MDDGTNVLLPVPRAVHGNANSGLAYKYILSLQHSIEEQPLLEKSAIHKTFIRSCKELNNILKTA